MRFLSVVLFVLLAAIPIANTPVVPSVFRFDVLSLTKQDHTARLKLDLKPTVKALLLKVS